MLDIKDREIREGDWIAYAYDNSIYTADVIRFTAKRVVVKDLWGNEVCKKPGNLMVIKRQIMIRMKDAYGDIIEIDNIVIYYDKLYYRLFRAKVIGFTKMKVKIEIIKNQYIYCTETKFPNALIVIKK